MVREALVTSVTCTPPSTPPVRFQMTQESMVPKRMSPRSARSRRPSTLSSSQRIFGPAKYEASGRPVSRRKRSWPTLRPSSLQSASVRVSCQTMALWTGSPVCLSQSTVVSRWLVMPIALTSAAVMPGLVDGAGDDLLDVGPDLRGVVLDPARLREDLLVLLLVDGDDPAVLVEDDAAAGGGALVDGRDERAVPVGGGAGGCRSWCAPEVCAGGVGAVRRLRRMPPGRCPRRWPRRSAGRRPGSRRSPSLNRPCSAAAEARARCADRGRGPG